MRVLILSVTTGEGHNSTAKALKKQFVESGNECEVLDVYLSASKGIYEIISKGYLLAVDAFKSIYEKIYKALEKKKKESERYGILAPDK